MWPVEFFGIGAAVGMEYAGGRSECRRAGGVQAVSVRVGSQSTVGKSGYGPKGLPKAGAGQRIPDSAKGFR